MSAELSLQIITAATALVAVAVGPWVAYWVARKQIHASVVSSNRQVWINTLRDVLTEFLAASTMTHSLAAASYADNKSLPRIESLLELARKIELLINPKEADHEKLSDLVSEVANELRNAHDEGATQELQRRQEQIVSLAQDILKREWERVKAGD
ncbi:MAG: hypothetical protein GY715_00400 [Planctomycetes bacterium]|nr:hypothetical protein [Planctomycetota bacterium]